MRHSRVKSRKGDEEKERDGGCHLTKTSDVSYKVPWLCKKMQEGMPRDTSPLVGVGINLSADKSTPAMAIDSNTPSTARDIGGRRDACRPEQAA